MILSLRGYAAHRGCALSAVQKAIKSGRIKLTADKKIDSEQADREWQRNTDPAMTRRPVQPPIRQSAPPKSGGTASKPVAPAPKPEQGTRPVSYDAAPEPLDVDFDQVEKHAAIGSTPEDILQALRLPVAALRHADFRAAVERGRSKGKIAALQGQFRAAQAGRTTAVKSLSAALDTPLPETDEFEPIGDDLADALPEEPAGPDFQKSRAAKEQYLAELRRLELEQKQGDLVQLAVVNAWVAGMIIRAATILDRIPDEFADRLSQETDPVVIRDLLRTELGRARNELAEYRATA
jgi:hypothetical protein